MSSLYWPQSFFLSFHQLKRSPLCLLLYWGHYHELEQWFGEKTRKQNDQMQKVSRIQSLFFNLATALKVQLALQSSEKHINANFERLL